MINHPPDASLTPDEIRRIRESFGLTQAAFEAALGLGPKTVVRWETGKVTPSQASKLLLRLLRRYPDAIMNLQGRDDGAEAAQVADHADDVEVIRHLISQPGAVIELERLVSLRITKALDLLDDARFPLDQQDASEEAIRKRLADYETAVEPLVTISLLLGRWGRGEHLPVLDRILRHLLVRANRSGGYLLWIGLQWYPLTLLYYAAGVAALSSGNWVVLQRLYDPETWVLPDRAEARSLADHVVNGFFEHGEAAAAFKRLPWVSQKQFSMSEALLEWFRRPVEEALFLDPVTYERCFDRFEVLRAVQYAAGPLTRDPRMWGPPGRFVWKLGTSDGGPLIEFAASVRSSQEPHPLLSIGSLRRGKEEVLSILEYLSRHFKARNWS